MAACAVGHRPAEAERVQVCDGCVVRQIEQEPAAVAGISPAPFGRFEDQHAAPGIVRGDRGRRPGRAIPGDHHLRHRQLRPGCVATMR
jgi:hypothetical protein